MKMNAAIYNPIDQAKESVSRSWLQLCADTSGEDRRRCSSLTNKRALLDNIGRVIPAMAPLTVGGILPGASGICQARVLLNETATHQH